MTDHAFFLDLVSSLKQNGAFTFIFYIVCGFVLLRAHKMFDEVSESFCQCIWTLYVSWSTF